MTARVARYKPGLKTLETEWTLKNTPVYLPSNCQCNKLTQEEPPIKKGPENEVKRRETKEQRSITTQPYYQCIKLMELFSLPVTRAHLSPPSLHRNPTSQNDISAAGGILLNH